MMILDRGVPACILLMAACSAIAQQPIEKYYLYNCSTCNGKQVDKKAFNVSTPLIELEQQQFVSQLQALRAHGPKGPGGRVKAGLSDEDIQQLAVYVRGLAAPAEVDVK